VLLDIVDVVEEPEDSPRSTREAFCISTIKSSNLFDAIWSTISKVFASHAHSRIFHTCSPGVLRVERRSPMGMCSNDLNLIVFFDAVPVGVITSTLSDTNPLSVILAAFHLVQPIG
jgi:hypothetical protein